MNQLREFVLNKTIHSLFLTALVSVFICACQSKPGKTEPQTLAGIDISKAPSSEVYDSPESVHWVPEVRAWFVSSMGGPNILAKDNYGWITRLDENGKVTDPRWVQAGFHAPGGICHLGKDLYVVDRDGIVVVNIDKAAITAKIEMPGVVFPNDSACDPRDQSVYVTDMAANKIYRWKKGMEKAEVWFESRDLDTPNGLEIDGDKLYVITWGPIVDTATSKTSRPGYLRFIDMKTKKISMGTGDALGNMDGITKAGKYMFGTDWMGGRIFRFDEKKKPRVWAQGFSHIADVGYSAELKVIGIPEMSTNRVYFIDVK
ncbi:hypothetical protein DOM22_09610 [Bdellovibrio sp. ZAP7]|nr:hypothetical protein DOM22_09610 [Bdellovibrio sp. ZAP7]